VKDLQEFDRTELQATESSTEGFTAHAVHANCKKTSYSPSDCMALLGMKDRTFFNYADQVVNTWYWLPESNIRKDGSYSQFGLDEISRRREYRLLKTYQEETWEREGMPPKPTFALTQPSAPPVVEAELEEVPTTLVLGSRGQITSQQSTRQVQPLLQISIESLQIQLPQADVSELNADTQKLQSINQQAIQVLTQYVSADLQSKVTELLSQNSNLAAAIQTAATVGAVQGIQAPKPQSADGSSS
jgi:hypothetical protein